MVNQPLTLVIPAFNRPEAFQRLLDSLDQSHDLHKLTRIILSLEGDASRSVVNKAYAWQPKDTAKHIWQHDAHLGVDAHVMACGDFSFTEGAVVILEDDTLVSPNFISYTLTLLDHAGEHPPGLAAGFSLYRYPVNYNQQPFYIPYASAFYLQKTPTRGQVFTPDQWKAFRDWLNQKMESGYTDQKIPKPIRDYPAYNWEKQFTHYLLDAGQFCLFPPWSYTTNFGDLGAHVKRKSEENAFQVPLQMDSQLPEVPKIEETTAVYDAYFELLPSRMKGLNPNLEPYDFEVDLYGTKPFEEIQKPYVLSCKKALNPEMTFGRNLKPHELNIAYEIEGRDFFLAKKENFRETWLDKWRRELRTHYYHYPDVSITKTLKMKIFEIFNRFL